jgi:hypothetical protein
MHEKTPQIICHRFRLAVEWNGMPNTLLRLHMHCSGMVAGCAYISSEVYEAKLMHLHQEAVTDKSDQLVIEHFRTSQQSIEVHCCFIVG